MRVFKELMVAYMQISTIHYYAYSNTRLSRFVCRFARHQQQASVKKRQQRYRQLLSDWMKRPTIFQITTRVWRLPVFTMSSIQIIE
jgi:hypothetical protein